MKLNQCIVGDNRDVLPTLPDGCIQTCVTSPPYWGLRDYGMGAQLGLEKSPDEYVTNMVQVFREVKRVLRDDGTLWLNLGDSYINHPASAVNRNGMSGSLNNGIADFPCRTNTRGDQQRIGIPTGLKVKDLAGIPWRVAFALQADGWYLRQDLIWSKPNPMPESVTDRCTKAHEYIFLLSKSAKYYYDAAAIAEPVSESYAHDKRPHGVLRQHFYPNSKYVKAGMMEAGEGIFPTGERDETRNKRSVWTVITKPFSGAHFATFPPDLIEPCILAGSKPGDVVLDPFGGSGTTGMVAEKLGRKWILIELNPAYEKLSRERTAQQGIIFSE